MVKRSKRTEAEVDLELERKNRNQLTLIVVIAVAIFVLWFILLGVIWNKTEIEDNFEDYRYCVEDCVSESEFCLNDVSTKYDVEDCSIELSSCINDCQY